MSWRGFITVALKNHLESRTQLRIGNCGYSSLFKYEVIRVSNSLYQIEKGGSHKMNGSLSSCIGLKYFLFWPTFKAYTGETNFFNQDILHSPHSEPVKSSQNRKPYTSKWVISFCINRVLISFSKHMKLRLVWKSVNDTFNLSNC